MRRLSLVLATAAAFGAPAVLHAHGGLKNSAPAANARVERPPRTLVLTFNDASPLSVTRVRLVGEDSVGVPLGALAHLEGSNERTVHVDVTGRLEAGTYAVEWQTAGEDGHPVRGRFTFVVLTGDPPEIAPAAAPTVPATPQAGASNGPSSASFDASSPAYVLVRWVTFLALVVLLGVVVFSTGVLRAVAQHAAALVPAEAIEDATRRTLDLGRVAILTLALATVARLAAQAYALFDADALDLRLIGNLIGGTTWGGGWLLQAGGVAGAWVALRAAQKRRAYGWPLLTLAVIALAATPALSGHASAVDDGSKVAVFADTLHVIGAGGWIGTLVLLAWAGIPAVWAIGEEGRPAALGTLVRAFSPVALVFSGVLLLTGAYAAWIHLGSIAALWESGYGRTLALKLIVLSGVTATGWYNWKRVTPRLGTAAGGQLLRRTATLEVAIAVLVLLVTAVLVATPTSVEMLSMPAGAEVTSAPVLPTG